MSVETNILLVDDNPKNLFVLRSLLENGDYRLIDARSGAQALKCLLERDFAVVLLDVNMPGMDGFETAKLIRERKRTCQVPIIFVTSVSHEEAQVFRGYSVGAVDYIMTPIVPEILRAKVSIFVELYRKTAQIVQQEQLLREAEKQAHERALSDERQRHEIEMLRLREEQILKEKETELKNTEVLARKAKELERSNMELERFAFAASHDLQEPLRTISIYSQLLKRSFNDSLSAEGNEYIRFIVDGAKRMQQMIRSLLDYSLLRQNASPAPLAADCNKIIESTLANLDGNIKESHATITFDKMPVVAGEESQLSQLFQNLISNAIKFRGEKEPKIHIGVTERTDCHQFCIEDNGIGIDSCYFDEIFGLFKRLNDQGKYSGSGLGLSLCKRIVENHKGNIWVQSEPGQGTKFFFTLPFPSSQTEGQLARGRG